MEPLITVLLTACVISYFIQKGKCEHDYQIEEIEIFKNGKQKQKSVCKKCGKVRIN